MTADTGPLSGSFAVEGERLLALILVINSEGFRVNNLFQLEDSWQANLTDGRLYWDFGTGTTPTAALEMAWTRVKADAGISPIEGSKTATIEPRKATRRVSSALQAVLDLDLEL